jgi:hypothetical protein
MFDTPVTDCAGNLTWIVREIRSFVMHIFNGQAHKNILFRNRRFHIFTAAHQTGVKGISLLCRMLFSSQQTLYQSVRATAEVRSHHHGSLLQLLFGGVTSGNIFFSNMIWKV